MYEVERLPQNIDIGYTGEQDFRTIEIDMSAWVAKVPDGQPTLMHIRPGEYEPYPVETTFEDNILTWSVSDEDLGTKEGTGLLQVWFGVEDEEQVLRQLGMSAVVATIVHLSLAGEGNNSSTVQIPWLKEVMEMKNIILGYDYEAESWAVGKRGGTDVPSTDPTYHNNAKYFSEQASAAKTAAEAAQEAAETAAERDVEAWLEENFTNPDSPPLDRTLALDTAAAPADMVGNLKSAIDVVYTGELSYTKEQAVRNSILYSSGYLYQTTGLTVGESTISDITANMSTGAKAYKVSLKNVKKLTYPVFKTSASYGSFIFNENDVVLWWYSEFTLDTGSTKTIDVPVGASYMLLSISPSLDAFSWGLTFEKASLNNTAETAESTKNRVDLLYGKTYSKSESIETFETISTNKLYQLTGIIPGISKLSNITANISTGAYALKIDLTNVKTITYPVFKSTSNYGSFIFDNEDTVLWMYTETTENTGTLKTIDVPENSSYMLLSISSSLASVNWSVSLYAIKQGSNDESGNPTATPFENVNRNMCLAGIKTDIIDNAIPYHRGFLFHKLQNNDNSLWYGTDFKKINKIGTVLFNPTLMRFAISPKDGRVIAVQRDTRNGIWVWDGTIETQLTDFATKPQAWLYNSGVDFIKDGTDEYCVFAEYSGTVSAGTVLNVWRGKYPYTSVEDWEIVLSKTQSTDITHFHMVRRDPWTNILYLTAGDSSAESKWWYSTDCGATWTLLVSGTDIGWGNSLCRTINFIFTADYIYWATDHGEASAEHHTLNRIARDEQTGVFDLSTKEQLTLLPKLYATNSLCYVESPNGLFMYDRIDTNSSSVFGEPIKMMFWDFATETLYEIVSLKLTSSTWGGSRGKCYINYTNTKQPYPAMGFSIDTPCIFNLVCDNPSNIGTIAYDVGSKTIRTIDY